MTGSAMALVRRSGIVIPFAILFVALSLLSDTFLRVPNLLNVLDQQAATIIVAAAGTLVLIAGGIDLSVGAIYALAGVVSASLVSSIGAGPAIAAGVFVGLAVGLANGLVVTRFRINALIATLAASFVVSGIAALVTQGNLVVAFDQPEFQ
ncbi:MAG: ABC transporter permease, partial [Chloroflexi bacterium]|nr:ABC transporter permease [Chloroflexota bacterium]